VNLISPSHRDIPAPCGIFYPKEALEDLNIQEFGLYALLSIKGPFYLKDIISKSTESQEKTIALVESVIAKGWAFSFKK